MKCSEFAHAVAELRVRNALHSHKTRSLSDCILCAVCIKWLSHYLPIHIVIIYYCDVLHSLLWVCVMCVCHSYADHQLLLRSMLLYLCVSSSHFSHSFVIAQQTCDVYSSVSDNKTHSFTPYNILYLICLFTSIIITPWKRTVQQSVLLSSLCAVHIMDAYE